MKKIISFLLLAALLVGCIVPAVVVSAADATLAVESVEKIQGTGTTVAPALTIANNPGISSLSVVVYYDKNELAQGDTSTAFEGALASEADSAVNGELAGTNAKVSKHIPSNLRSSSKAFIIDLCGAYNEETETTDTITADGVLVNIPLEIIAGATGAYTYTVVVAEAYDAEGNELEIASASATITLAADPLVGIYDEFTVFTNPADTDVTIGTTSIDVDIRFDCNPGLWATRIYVTYSDALTLAGADGAAKVDNSYAIYTEKADINLGIADLPLSDDRIVADFKEVIAAQGIETEGYQSTTVYFEPAEYDKVVSSNGVLCTLHFDIASDVEVGDVLDIKLYYNEAADFLWAGTDPETNKPIFKSYAPTTIGSTLTIVEKVCAHENTTDSHLDATCGTAGYDKVTCDDCGAILSDVEIPATGAHTEGTPVVVEPTCGAAGSSTVSCSVCNVELSKEEIPATGAHTPGAEATCQAPQTCTVCGTELAGKTACTEGEPVITPATCDEDGKNVWNCTVCGEFIREEILPATGHITLQPGNIKITVPTCTTDGYTERTCDVCGDVTVGDVVPAYGHTIAEDNEGTVTKEATCGAEGELTFYCDDCYEVAKVEVIPVKTTHNLEYVAAVEASCHQTGNNEYWFCVDCDAVYTDAEGKYLSNRLNVIIPALNELAYVPAAEACHVDGTYEYWFCPECDAVFADAAGIQLTNRLNLTIPADCDLVHIEAVEPCHANGTYEYWFCPECDAVFADEAGTMRTNRMNLTIPADAEAKHVEAVAATCTENGCAEYWYCEECDTFFADAECKYNVAYLSLTIPATGHDYKDGACTICGDKENAEDDENKAPVTGDNFVWIVVALAVVLVAGTAIVFIRRRRSN